MNRNKFPNRMLAILLSMIMTLSVIPSSTLSALAATPEDATIAETPEQSDEGIMSAADMAITGVTVTPASVSFAEDNNGKAKEYDAVSVSGTQNGDTVTYSMGGTDYGSQIPKISAVGKYPVTVTVKRQEFDDYTQTVEAEVRKGKIDVTVTPLQRDYKEGLASAPVTVTGAKANDTVTYVMNGAEYGKDNLPSIENAGTYKITVKVVRNGNYEVFEQTYEARISPIDIAGLSATLYKGVYDQKKHDAVLAVKGTKAGDVVEYQKDGGEWSTTIPTVENAGEYKIAIRVRRNSNNYNETQIIDLTPSTVIVEKAKQTIRFNQYGEEVKLAYDTEDEAKNVFDFSATGGVAESPTITYSVVNDAENDTTDISEIAAIDENGQLTIKKAGFLVKVIATVEGTTNYSDTSVECHVIIPNESDDLLTFDNTTMSYVNGANNGVISEQKATKVYGNDDKGTITYTATIDNKNSANYGVEIDPASGKVSVNEDKSGSLRRALKKNNGSVIVEVKASKTPGTKQQIGGKKFEVYKNGENSYSIKIVSEAAPADAYTLQDLDGKGLTAPNGENGWYNTPVKVIPKEGYRIAKEEDVRFSDSVVFDDQGSNVRTIYLKNRTTGVETAPVIIDVEKIDSVKPDSSKINIEYSEPVIDKILWFYDAPVTVTFTAYDETSGVDSFVWKYTRDADASESNLETENGTVTAQKDDTDSAKYTGSITLPKSQADQLKGSLTVNAVDKAGLWSEDKKDDGRVFVVDTISPTETVSYQLKETGGTSQIVDEQHYFSDDVEFTFGIKEANFYPEDITVKVSKDHAEAEEVEVAWTDTAEQDGHEANYVLSGDGDYVVTMEYKDRMAHRDGKYVTNEKGEVKPITVYTSEVVTIDTIAPVIDFSYSNDNNTSADLDNVQTATVTVTEHNFRASDLEVIAVTKDITGADVTTNNIQEILRTASWKQDGDVYTTTLSGEFVDAIYDLTFHYKDLALNPAVEVKTGEFIVDHTAPQIADMKVSYSVPVIEKIISAVTFGYYNPDVTVTLEAKDMTSGVDYFTWSYTKEDGASKTNVKSYADAKLQAVQDAADLSKFTASFTLPKDTADQLRGNLAFTATDQYSNTGDKLTDTGHIIVVDTIAPTMTAEYTEAQRTAGNTMYYNKDMTATFTVTEANFYAEDVMVEVSKNGGAFSRISPTWKDESTDTHIGTYTIKAYDDHSNDADYVFRIQYTDRSKNQMSLYTSDTITIDTIRPVIAVEYRNQKVVHTLTDSENHKRQYLDDTQTATVTVTEHNFDADEVDFTIIAKDVEGKELDANRFSTKTAWSQQGDTHTMTITYPGDANYTFDVAYTDLATNKADNYEKDYFTVDKTAPKNLTVKYSNSILNTVLQKITFGFYNAKMTVTIIADDSTSKVHSFDYDYTLASGVSKVNAELIHQAIQDAKITYSDNHKTATTKFNIPKNTLKATNQFNGNVSFTATDRAGNTSVKLKDKKRIVVDNITPTAKVVYNNPVQVSGGISYYDGPVTATVTMNEANFYPEDVQVSVTKGGAAYSVTPSWSNNSTDVHVGTFTLNDDGDYFVTINYTDKSSNKMVTYTSEQMTVDTEIVQPVITVNGKEANGKAFREDVVPAVSFEDINFESYEIKLARTRYDDKNADVTKTFIKNAMNISDQGGTGSFDTFVKKQDVDGIYTMTVSMTDKAGHSAETSSTFTVNRFGSVYEYGDYLVSLVKDGGAYIPKVEKDLVITEYNADRLVSDSLDIEVSKDGKPLSDVDYEIAPEMNNKVNVGSSGWYQYKYTISKDNFDTDGVYKISVSSKDATGNAPEIANYEDKDILFRVDSTAPEIASITGFEENIINAQSVDAKYTVYDTIGLASVKVYVDGDAVDTITDFKEDRNNYEGSFKVSEKNSTQSIRLVVEDLAGNVTDTSAEDFESAFTFNKSVTVSTNFFVRFYANKPLFWGSISGVAAVAALIIIVLMKRRKDDEEPEENEAK